MKLTPPTPPVAPTASTPASSVHSEKTEDFDRLLTEAIAKKSRDTDPAIVDGANTLSAVVPIDFESHGMDTLEADLEHFIDRLDAYRERLADPEWSLRDIEPMLSSVTAMKEKLVRQHETLSDTHPLKEILSEGLVAASMEAERFYRGDYC